MNLDDFTKDGNEIVANINQYTIRMDNEGISIYINNEENDITKDTSMISILFDIGGKNTAMIGYENKDLILNQVDKKRTHITVNIR